MENPHIAPDTAICDRLGWAFAKKVGNRTPREKALGVAFGPGFERMRARRVATLKYRRATHHRRTRADLPPRWTGPRSLQHKPSPCHRNSATRLLVNNAPPLCRFAMHGATTDSTRRCGDQDGRSTCVGRIQHGPIGRGAMEARKRAALQILGGLL